MILMSWTSRTLTGQKIADVMIWSIDSAYTRCLTGWILSKQIGMIFSFVRTSISLRSPAENQCYSNWYGQSFVLETQEWLLEFLIDSTDSALHGCIAKIFSKHPAFHQGAQLYFKLWWMNCQPTILMYWKCWRRRWNCCLYKMLKARMSLLLFMFWMLSSNASMLEEEDTGLMTLLSTKPSWINIQLCSILGNLLPCLHVATTLLESLLQ